MPVLSPHRSSSGLTGSYRSSLGSSSLNRPLYSSSTSYSPNYYYERYSTRSYSDSDGRRLYSRSGSITEDGKTTRFYEESREGSARRDSLSRDSGIGSIRENSILDTKRDRDSSLSRSDSGRSDRYTQLNVVDSLADLRNKYSPANYVPAVYRNRGENVSRSKSINDIGLPPIEKDGTLKKGKKVKDSFNNGVTANNTNDNMYPTEDTNGNAPPPPVAELRKRFEPKTNYKKSEISDDVKRPIKLSKLDLDIAEKIDSVKSIINGLESKTIEKNDDSQAKTLTENDLDGKDWKNGTRTSDFSSYIPVKAFEKAEVNGGDVTVNGEVLTEAKAEATKRKLDDIAKNDLTTSQRLSKGLSQSNASAAGTSSAGSASNSVVVVGRSSIEPDEDKSFDKKVLASPVAHQGLNGLKNIGNTCFMNSVIQCLSNTRPLLEYLRKDQHAGEINTTISGMKGALIKAFAQVIKEVWSEDSSDRVVNTVALKSQIQRFAPRFMGYAQQDAQEFLRYLLEGLHEDVNRVTTKPAPIHTEIDEKLSDSEKSAESWQRYLRMDNSKIVDIFVGQLKSTLKCTHCGHCSVTFDPFWDLSLPIPQKVGPVRLQQCLDSFTREETLDGDEKPTCSKCKERRKCTKTFAIQKFPKIMVIHLKRFSPTERFRGKLSVTVDFPLEGLDMNNYAAESHTQCRYNLYAISNHSGTTYSGHYTAYCRHPYSMAWHEYNDSRVSTISSKSIISGEAYVLFYELEGQKSHL